MGKVQVQPEDHRAVSEELPSLAFLVCRNTTVCYQRMKSEHCKINSSGNFILALECPKHPGIGDLH